MMYKKVESFHAFYPTLADTQLPAHTHTPAASLVTLRRSTAANPVQRLPVRSFACEKSRSLCCVFLSPSEILGAPDLSP
jgi:hypothetical protein